MINGKILHDKFRLIVNRKNSGYNENIEPYELDCYLNRALHTWLENRVALAETNAQVENDLRELEIKHHQLSLKNHGEEYDVFELPKDMFSMLRQWALVYTKECCKEEPVRRIDVRLNQSDDLEEVLKSPNWGPSYDWEETVADKGSEGLYVWHNQCFCIKELYIDYIRKPKDIKTPSAMSCGEYEDAEGNVIKADVCLELTSTYQSDYLVELAAAYYFRDMGDASALQSMLGIINYTEGYLTGQP